MKNDDARRALQATKASAVALLEDGTISPDEYAGTQTMTIENALQIADIGTHLLRVLGPDSVAGALAAVLLMQCQGDVLEAKRQVAKMATVKRETAKRLGNR